MHGHSQNNVSSRDNESIYLETVFTIGFMNKCSCFPQYALAVDSELTVFVMSWG